MELAAYEQKRKLKAVAAAMAPIDPEALGRAILEKAGGTVADAQAVVPLLKRADEHTTFEKQMSGN